MSNLEYLKNVVLKVLSIPVDIELMFIYCLFSSQFLHTQGAERSGLIPIVTKLLQLSPQEIKFLQETVKGLL